MPVVPITAATSRFAAAQAKGKVPQGPPPAEPFALMAAAQMHAEGRLLASEPSGKNALAPTFDMNAHSEWSNG